MWWFKTNNLEESSLVVQQLRIQRRHCYNTIQSLAQELPSAEAKNNYNHRGQVKTEERSGSSRSIGGRFNKQGDLVPRLLPQKSYPCPSLQVNLQKTTTSHILQL